MKQYSETIQGVEIMNSESMQSDLADKNPQSGRYDVDKHYKIEKELASKLLNASREERRVLFGEVYDELFRRVEGHPMVAEKSDPEKRYEEVKDELTFLKKYLHKEAKFAEIGPGDCAVSFEVAKHVSQVYGVDVSEVITSNAVKPENFQLLLTDGTSIPLPENSIDLVYSNQLMEHLHPDDAETQLQNIYRALKKGGVYFCQTPNRLYGPCDVSFGFDEVATGFHLKEYTATELAGIFKRVGFKKVRLIIGAKGIYLTIPAFLLSWVEKLLGLMSYSARIRMTRTKLMIALLSIRILGFK